MSGQNVDTSVTCLSLLSPHGEREGEREACWVPESGMHPINPNLI